MSNTSISKTHAQLSYEEYQKLFELKRKKKELEDTRKENNKLKNLPLHFNNSQTLSAVQFFNPSMMCEQSMDCMNFESKIQEQISFKILIMKEFNLGCDNLFERQVEIFKSRNEQFMDCRKLCQEIITDVLEFNNKMNDLELNIFGFLDENERKILLDTQKRRLYIIKQLISKAPIDKSILQYKSELNKFFSDVFPHIINAIIVYEGGVKDLIASKNTKLMQLDQDKNAFKEKYLGSYENPICENPVIHKQGDVFLRDNISKTQGKIDRISEEIKEIEMKISKYREKNQILLKHIPFSFLLQSNYFNISYEYRPLCILELYEFRMIVINNILENVERLWGVFKSNVSMSDAPDSSEGKSILDSTVRTNEEIERLLPSVDHFKNDQEDAGKRVEDVRIKYVEFENLKKEKKRLEKDIRFIKEERDGIKAFSK